ncbi:MAG: hypothetical protein IKU62_07025 [Ruminiclostridium sp.]|nr:hypothetical protein [Ruminiclostridium sp.]
MKRMTALCLVTVLLFSLCACGSQPQEETPVPEEPAVTVTEDPNLGRYICTAVTMDGMDLGPDGQWLTLKGGGEAVLYLGGEADEARWSLSGTTFTLTMGSQIVATGTLADGTLTVKLMGMDCIFVREAALTETPETAYTPSMGTFSCQGLYTVTYPQDSFQAPGDGLTDLLSPTGTKVWLTKLDSRADVRQWRNDMESKLTETTVLQSEQLELTAGDYAAEGLVYETADGWQTALLVDFGRNLGSDGRSVAAACLYISAPTREEVWNETIQSMVTSLKLGQ